MASSSSFWVPDIEDASSLTVAGEVAAGSWLLSSALLSSVAASLLCAVIAVAVAAAQADFKAAQRLQKRAIKAAKRLEWDLRDVNHRQESYRRGEKWSGPYYYDIALAPAQLEASAN